LLTSLHAAVLEGAVEEYVLRVEYPPACAAHVTAGKCTNRMHATDCGIKERGLAATVFDVEPPLAAMPEGPTSGTDRVSSSVKASRHTSKQMNH
jgi:hypothetical protein